jgi:hypothetical protein
LAAVIAGIAGVTTPAAAWSSDTFPIVELRQYTLHEGQRDTLIDLFEREFVESQEAVGLKVIGTFRDLDHPNRFVWLRGFRDMDARAAGLSSFYNGPVWKSNRDAANSTMVDSDNVLLLEAPSKDAEFTLPASRPALGEVAPAGLLTATIYHLKVAPAEASSFFEKRVVSQLVRDGVQPVAWFITESAPNNFPRLPVREGKPVLVWFAAFPDDNARQAHQKAFDGAASALTPMFGREPELLRLQPTSRSLIRGPSAADNKSAVHDFDFLHGSWSVHHRRLKQRGEGSRDWIEFEGTAETRPLLGGMCNIEENKIGDESSGIALRCLDRSSGQWAIYWVSQRDGRLQPPVHGSFRDGVGEFQGDDVDGGRKIRVRYLWRALSLDAARWEQAFSYDAGATWETNWIMEFNRPGQ